MADEDKRLRETFEFNLDDPVAIHQEKLTPQQRTVLEEKAKFFLIISIVSTVVCLCIGLVVIWSAGVRDIVLALFLFGLVVLLSFLFIWPKYTDWKEDINSGEVAVMCGPVFLEILEGNRFRFTSYRLKIGSETFKITQAQLLALQHGHDYCVYYAPKTKTVFSVEEVPSSTRSTPSQSVPA